MKTLTLKSETAAVVRLGAPLIAFFLIQNLASLACLAFVGRLGDASLAGFGASSAIYGVVLALMFGFDTGVQALVSRATGAGEKARAGELLIDALAVSAPLGALLGVALWCFGPTLVAGMLHDPAAAAAGAANLRTMLAESAMVASHRESHHVRRSLGLQCVHGHHEAHGRHSIDRDPHVTFLSGEQPAPLRPMLGMLTAGWRRRRRGESISAADWPRR